MGPNNIRNNSHTSRLRIRNPNFRRFSRKIRKIVRRPVSIRRVWRRGNRNTRKKNGDRVSNPNPNANRNETVGELEVETEYYEMDGDGSLYYPTALLRDQEDADTETDRYAPPTPVACPEYEKLLLKGLDSDYSVVDSRFN